MKAQQELRKFASKERAQINQRFFKTGEGQYGHGDVFIGVRVPQIRQVAKANTNLNLKETRQLVRSKIHEERMLGLLILSNKYEQATTPEKKERLYLFYIKQFNYINNWDLVDTTAPQIVGQHLMDKDRSILYEWAESPHLWTRRIAIVSTWWMIRKNDLEDVFSIAAKLLFDEEDLIHKATGWMLREAAKKDAIKAEKFLKKNYKKMPRTMLRYAIERLPETKRQKYLKGKI